jgi:imidazolonepropionase-like amidohydrolase
MGDFRAAGTKSPENGGDVQSLRFWSALAGTVSVVLSAHAYQTPETEPGDPATHDVTAFIDTHVVPMDRERQLDHQTVLVAAGRIVAMGPAGKVKIPAEARRIEARSEWLLPGLADMHVHVRVDDDLALFITNGVTTALHMGAAPSDMVALDRQAIAAGKLVGPQLFFAFLVDGTAARGNAHVNTPQQARAMVQFAKANDYDFIKVYNSIDAAEFSAIVEEAHSLEMAVIGHGVRAVGLPAALYQGQVMVAHGEEFYYTAFAHKIDDAAIPGVAAATRGSGAWVTPNLSGYESFAKQWGKPDVVSAFLRAPEMAYLSPQTRVDWSTSAYQFRQGSITDTLAFLRRFTRALSDAGVPLLTGTDAPLPGLLPGYSEHDDLQALVDSGLTTYQALVAATRSPGEFIRKFVPAAEPFGVVGTGMRADLVLVRDNPLAHLETLRTPLGVMAHGRWYDAAALAGLLKDRKERYAAVLCHEGERSLPRTPSQ